VDALSSVSGQSRSETPRNPKTRQGSVGGGHLLDGAVRPTLEVTIVETAAHLRRKKHPDLGLALIEP
jgi:predicted DNA-binding protein with PD1-like motif